MFKKLTTSKKIEVLSIGFPFGHPDEAGMSIFFGPHECTALFVAGINSAIEKKECEALQKAIASALNGEIKSCPMN